MLSEQTVAADYCDASIAHNVAICVWFLDAEKSSKFAHAFARVRQSAAKCSGRETLNTAARHNNLASCFFDKNCFSIIKIAKSLFDACNNFEVIFNFLLQF